MDEATSKAAHAPLGGTEATSLLGHAEPAEYRSYPVHNGGPGGPRKGRKLAVVAGVVVVAAIVALAIALGVATSSKSSATSPCVRLHPGCCCALTLPSPPLRREIETHRL